MPTCDGTLLLRAEGVMVRAWCVMASSMVVFVVGQFGTLTLATHVWPTGLLGELKAAQECGSGGVSSRASVEVRIACQSRLPL
jgi:hypothetical protein